MRNFPTLSVAVACVLTFAGMKLHAQTFSWATHTSGESGDLIEGATAEFGWDWEPGGVYITGNLTITRTGAGTTYVGAESMDEALQVIGHTTGFDNPVLEALGGSTGMYHFINEGESNRGTVDREPDNPSTTHFSFTFDGDYSSPENTIIALFDPGAYGNDVGGVFTYTFRAWNNGQVVDVSLWQMSIVDAFPNSIWEPTEDITWSITGDSNSMAGVLRVDGFAPYGDYPDSVILLDTMGSTFDHLEVVAESIAVDTFAIGFGASTAPVPEPAGALLFFLAGLLGISRRRR